MSITEGTRGFVANLFRSIEAAGGDYSPLLAALDDGVVWTVSGSSPIAGVYQGKQDYAARCFGRLDEKLESWPVATVQQIVVDGDTAVVFFHGAGGKGRNGTDYSMDYAWRLRVAGDRIVEVTGYYDGLKVAELFT